MQRALEMSMRDMLTVDEAGAGGAGEGHVHDEHCDHSGMEDNGDDEDDDEDEDGDGGDVMEDVSRCVLILRPLCG